MKQTAIVWFRRDLRLADNPALCAAVNDNDAVIPVFLFEAPGADAAPYFRVFNPLTQGEKFDGSGAYVRRWVPELEHLPD